MIPTQQLAIARDILDRPARWCKGCLCIVDGRRSNALVVNDATAYCLLGAIFTAGTLAPDATDELISLACVKKAIGQGTIEDFNDHPSTRHADVLAALDLAIEEAQQLGK